MDNKEKLAFELAIEACRATVQWAQTPGNHGGNPWCMPHVQLADNALKALAGHKLEWKVNESGGAPNE